MNAFNKYSYLMLLLPLPALAYADSGYAWRVATTALIFILLAASANLLTGVSGLMSLGHGAIYGLGAYASALLSTQCGLGAWLALPLAGAAASLIGFLVTLPTLRLVSIYFAVATLGIGEIIYVTLLNWVDLTRGPMGITDIPTLGGGQGAIFWETLAITLACLYLIHRVMHSYYGNALRALREDDQCIQALGLSPFRLKSQVLLVSYFFAGIAGALWAHTTGYIAPDSFKFDQSVLILAMVVVGGLGSLPGAIIGAILLIALPEVLRPIGDYRMFTVGLILFLTILFRPKGLWPEAAALKLVRGWWGLREGWK
ncbi:branched-chain amino acid ABC transporter permease [Sodalis ligni]|jgi:branched-chain amino acid transport system permease protein|uniref:Branched-chain amino acid transport system permease protein n=1 Tax=Sodalis ligni TaxID=2697027 RepID=A0A4R1ND75_9GAMM|nr:branched-chain amino acid ABC transporter permease [Sodalis ligni]TCL03571.1 branched-chain amino acid transport system permease protein [Sodalis ligni]